MQWEEFCKCIHEFKELSDELRDGWTVHHEKAHDFGLYLAKKQIFWRDSEVVNFEYHVAYNSNYCVPVLYLQLWESDGSLVNFEDCWKYCNFSENENMYSTLTQMDHPVLFLPYLTLHPCKTEEIMKIFHRKSKNLLVSWLSMVGPIVHLTLLPEYSKLTG